MTAETDIDCEKSLRTHRLQIRPYWLEFIDTTVILMLATGLIVYPILIYPLINKNNPNDTFLAYTILPLSMIFGVIFFYKKLTEKKLKRIDTGFNKDKNHSLSIAFMKTQGFKIIKNNNDIVIGIRAGDFTSWSKQVNILIDTGSVYACVLTLSPKARVPSLFNAKNIIKELQRFMTQESQQATGGFASAGRDLTQHQQQ